mgnify:CR=1 FL=1
MNNRSNSLNKVREELENELTFDAKTFSISVTRTMDGSGGENDYDYVAIGN